MKRIVSLLLLLTALTATLRADTISDLLGRILPENADAAKFNCTTTGNSGQQFTIACDGKQVTVSGSDNVCVAAGINWYLQHYAGIDISWNAPTATLPKHLPVCEQETHESSVDWRYYLNFCTYSYSMAFWNWERWQQELDWMALHGINMPLAITGMECVWREVLMNTYGYTQRKDGFFYFTDDISHSSHWIRRRGLHIIPIIADTLHKSDASQFFLFVTDLPIYPP